MMRIFQIYWRISRKQDHFLIKQQENFLHTHFLRKKLLNRVEVWPFDWFACINSTLTIYQTWQEWKLFTWFLFGFTSAMIRGRWNRFNNWSLRSCGLNYAKILHAKSRTPVSRQFNIKLETFRNQFHPNISKFMVGARVVKKSIGLESPNGLVKYLCRHSENRRYTHRLHWVNNTVNFKY